MPSPPVVYFIIFAAQNLGVQSSPTLGCQPSEPWCHCGLPQSSSKLGGVNSSIISGCSRKETSIAECFCCCKWILRWMSWEFILSVFLMFFKQWYSSHLQETRPKHTQTVAIALWVVSALRPAEMFSGTSRRLWPSCRGKCCWSKGPFFSWVCR